MPDRIRKGGYMKNMLKQLWECLPFGKPRKYLAMNNELVRRMDTGQKFDYAINAIYMGWWLWHNNYKCNRRLTNLMNCAVIFQGGGVSKIVGALNITSKYFQSIAQGKLPAKYKNDYKSIPPTMMELAYAFWSLQRMLAIAYPEHGFKLEGANVDRCDYDEALSRIASSIVSSVAIAYGHAHGLRKHNKAYRQMLDYGDNLLSKEEGNGII